MKRQVRANAAMIAPLVGCGILVSGCMGGPTYGTDKTATAQLGSDLSSVFSLRPRVTSVGEYKPRPELVKPASTAALPAPQDSIVTADNPQWPESPEQRRTRLRAEATANQGDNLYEPMIVDDTLPKSKLSGLTPEQKNNRDAAPMSNVESRQVSRQVQQARAEAQVSPTNRKYLSEPPLTYRQAATTAAVGELGEDELKKQRRIKREATKGGGGGWRDWIPGF